MQTAKSDDFKTLTDLINQSRVTRGWQMMTAEETVRIVPIWHKVLTETGIPAEQYAALFKRAHDARTRQISDGHKPTELSPEFLASQWSGRNGLAAEIREKSTDLSGEMYYLTAGDGSKMLYRDECPKCLNTGFEMVTRGMYRGVVDCGCRHGRRRNG